jgi:glycine oxidase
VNTASRLPDVIVVGGGIIGGSIAWRLAQHGLRIVMFEAGAFGGEASSAGAGMLIPGGEIQERSLWSMRGIESRRLYPAFVSELQAEADLCIDYRECGAVELAADAAEADALRSRAVLQQDLGIRSSPTTLAEVRELAPALSPDVFQEARWYPDDALVNPVDVMQALRAALLRRNAVIHEHTPVTSVDVDLCAVEWNGGWMEAGWIVVAAGAWTSQLVRRVPEAIPVKGHLIGYDQEPGSLPPIVRHGHRYLLQRSNGFTIAGASVEHRGFDRSLDSTIVEKLHNTASRYLPGLLASPPSKAWTGLRPGVDAAEPQVRRIEGTDVWLAYGHYRNGILLAPVTAKLMAGSLLSQEVV